MEDVTRYLDALGVSAFDATFYLPQGTEALLVEKHGAVALGEKELGLEDVRASF